jgi:putative hemolysin
LAKGFFAVAGMALHTARRMRLKMLAERGGQMAAKALVIQDSPGDFLATVQIGITLPGTASSDVASADVVRVLPQLIACIPGLSPHADVLALAW